MNCLATRRRDQPRRERGVGLIQGGERRMDDSKARDGGSQKSEKFVNFVRLYRPRDRVQCQWI